MNTPRLDVAKILYGAFALPWRQREDFARTLMLPLALLFTLTVSWTYMAESLATLSQWLLFFLYGILFTLFAVPCHRLVLMGPKQGAGTIPDWRGRETRFLASMALLWATLGLVFVVAMVVFDTLALNIFGSERWENLFASEIHRWVVGLPAYYVMARLSLVLPAIAIDRKASLPHIWALSRDNGLRLMAVVWVLPWGLSAILDTAYRDNASALEHGILTLLGCVSFAIEICALSLAYRELNHEI